MKIIIAPAKSMKYKQTAIKLAIPKYRDKQRQLHTLLTSFSLAQIQTIMKVSTPIACEVYSYYHQNLPTCPSLYYYSGAVFKQLEYHTYQDKEFDYLDTYVNILSAYYGVLKYNDAISPYRLDMTMKFEQLSLYAFWQKELEEYFKKEDYIISLASKEFTKMVTHPNIIEIDFVEEKDTKLVRRSMFVKQARGKMLQIMITRKIIVIEDIKTISFDGYRYCSSLSTDKIFVFHRVVTK